MSSLFGALQSDELLNPYAELAKTASSTQDVNATSTTGTVYYISWDSQINVDTGFTHSTSTNNTRLTIADAGVYLVIANIKLDNQQGATVRAMYSGLLRVNGTTVVDKGAFGNYSRGTSYNNYINVGVVTHLTVTSGQYIEAGVRLDHTGAAGSVNTADASCQLIVRRIR